MTSGKVWWKGFADVLLWVAAIGGFVSIGLLVASVAFGVGLIMFKTGSMSPGMPAGSLAVVREIPAREIRVGDVITLDRVNELPITHRVTSVLPEEGEFRAITMRGDANLSDDASAYVVDRGRIVMWSMPGLSNVVVWFSNPLVLGGLSVGTALLVTWAFWPKMLKRKRKHLADSSDDATDKVRVTASLHDERAFLS